jgi:hypothetical protein
LAGLTFAGRSGLYWRCRAGKLAVGRLRVRAPFTLAERLLTEGRVLWFYLGLIAAAATRGASACSTTTSGCPTGLIEPWTTMPALLAALAGLAWLAWRLRARAPLVAFGIAWFLIGHAAGIEPCCRWKSPMSISNYVPLFGVLIALAAALLPQRARGGGQPRKPSAWRWRAVALLLSAASSPRLRAHQFGDAVRRSQIEVQHHRGVGAGAVRRRAGPGACSTGCLPARFDRRYSFAQDAPASAPGNSMPTSRPGWLLLIHLDCRAGLGARTRRWSRSWRGRLQRDAVRAGRCRRPCTP